MASDIERIVAIIGSKPVLGHWPHMQAHKDIAILRNLEADVAVHKEMNKSEHEEIARLRKIVEEWQPIIEDVQAMRRLLGSPASGGAVDD